MSGVAVSHRIPPRAARAQALIGLSLATLILGAWLSLHVYALFVFTLDWQTLPAALIMAVVQCWLSVGLFIVSHDAMHGSLAPGRPRLNSAIGATLLFLYAGFVWSRMRDAHHAHHRHAGRSGDPDFDEDHPTRFWRWYATFIRRYFGIRSVLFVSTVVTLYWLVLGVPMAQIVLLYGLPAIASSLQLFYFGTWRPHNHCGGAFADHHNARSDGLGVLASLASCFHFGYHHEHHLAPGVPWWRLPSHRHAVVQREPARA
ncbi:beta-carotene ketolase [Erythrobacteraceae bacterium CFH 75059]|uniref:fatty acid desaturase n=1 Tax=Qipengyuania thermophila TaxID=2509361 RepID=UPI0010217961|nr:fatty acid desaturase [Qipengyuania thermophila]TCD01871.1 beta-carotene ketolase [Erythrobacteraceae bacterium CFH 75059]